MAVVKLDPVTYPKYWKITPDNASPLVFFMMRKPLRYFKQTTATTTLIYDHLGSATTTIATAGADAINAAGVTLATAAAVIDYITANDN